MNLRYKQILLSIVFFLVCILSAPTPTAYCAQAHSTNAQQRVLRWGADANSGAPYVFRDAKNPEQVIGMDVDIVQAIAAQLNRKTEFIQNNWDGLIPGLNSKNYDIVIDGIEITDERKNVVLFSKPYYSTYNQLVVKSTTNSIHSKEDLSGKTVATLPASLSYTKLKQIKDVNVVVYNEELNAYDDLAAGKLIDAVLLDWPTSMYYAKPNPLLKLTDIHIGTMNFAVALRNDEVQLKKEIDGAIKVLTENGTLKKIIEKWGLWNASTASLLNLSETTTSQPYAYQDFVKQYQNAHHTLLEKLKLYAHLLPLLGKGALMTLQLSILSITLAIFLGFFIALVRIYAPRPFSFLAATYVDVIRGTPLLIQLYLIFYGLPYLGIKLEPFLAATVGLGLNYAANEAENYRAGITAIPGSQIDAAYSLGLSWWQTLRKIVIPQATTMVIPPMTNDFIALIKDSSLVSVITLVELTTIYSQLASTYFDYFGIGILVAAMYFLIGLPFSRLSLFLERKLQTNTDNSALINSRSSFKNTSKISSARAFSLAKVKVSLVPFTKKL